ncbi:MAG: GtrA family protein [Gallionella sp.]
MSDSVGKRSSGQLVRYGLVGIASNLSGYLVYLLITYWGGGPKVTMTLLYIVGASVGFYGNRQWTFAHKGAVLKSSSRYFVAHFFGYLINLFILLTFVDELGYPHQWVQAAAVLVVAGFLFVVFKYFVFPKSESSVRGSE